MGEHPNQVRGDKQERPAHRASIEDEFELPGPGARLELAKRALEMADPEAAPRPRLVPRLSIQMAPDTRRDLKQEVARTITKYLNVNSEEYARYGGLQRLLKQVSDVTGWTQAEVYTLALQEAKGVEFDLLEGTIREVSSN
jgi:hypothetical protein